MIYFFIILPFIFIGHSAHAVHKSILDFVGISQIKEEAPWLNGQGLGVMAVDKSFDITHPALGWIDTTSNTQNYMNLSNIPNLHLKNPRVKYIYSLKSIRDSPTDRWSASSEIINNPIIGSTMIYSRDALPTNPNYLDSHGTLILGIVASNASGDNKGICPNVDILASSTAASFSSPFSDPHLKNLLDTQSVNLAVAHQSNSASSSLNLFTNSDLTSQLKKNHKIVTIESNNNSAQTFFKEDKGASSRDTRWWNSNIYSLLAGAYDIHDQYISIYGSRGQETLLLPHRSNIENIYLASLMPNNRFGSLCCTSGTSPFLAGGITLLRQYYQNTFNQKITQTDYERILKKSAKLVNDVAASQKLFIVDFKEALEILKIYNPHQQFHNLNLEFSNFRTFNLNDVHYHNSNATIPKHHNYLDPKFFRVSSENLEIDNNDIRSPHINNSGEIQYAPGINYRGRSNFVLRNGWGEILRYQFLEPGKTLTLNTTLRYENSDNNWYTVVGLKEMIGSNQFMTNKDILETYVSGEIRPRNIKHYGDSSDIGRIALKINKNLNSGFDFYLLKSTSYPSEINNREIVWNRVNEFLEEEWTSSTYLGNEPIPNEELAVEINIDYQRIKIQVNNRILFDADHKIDNRVFDRSSAYVHFNSLNSQSSTIVKNLSAEYINDFDVVNINKIKPHPNQNALRIFFWQTKNLEHRLQVKENSGEWIDVKNISSINLSQETSVDLSSTEQSLLFRIIKVY